MPASRLAVATKVDRVAALPGCATGAANSLVVFVPFPKTAVLATSRCKGTQFAVLVDRLADPVDTRIPTNGFVERINEYYLVILVGSVVANPIRAENTETSTLATNSLLGDTLEATLELQLVNTHVGRFTEGVSFADGALTSTTPDTYTVNNISLLCLEPKKMQDGIIRSIWFNNNK